VLLKRAPWLLALLAVIALVAAACGDDDDSSSDTSAGGDAEKSGKIALLLPESKTARYETQDRPNFTAKIAELCPDCEVLYSNAEQDAAKQQQQAEAALTNGAEVLVLDPVDGAAAAVIASQAKAKGVPVIAYDRLIQNADIDYYVSYDNETVGKLQAQSLLDKLTEDGNGDGTIIMINGSPDDNNATLFKKGAHSVFDTSTLKIGAESDNVGWSPDRAQQQADQAITNLGKDGFVGAYAANDGTASGIIAAMKAAGIDPSTRPVTGQDAELAGLQRILIGEQFMTVYKAVKPETDPTAELAVALLRGQTPTVDTSVTVNNGQEDVPSVILDPVAVTKDNVNVPIDDGAWTAAEVCKGYEAACEEAGITTTQ
jgi:D-xylose transport system substrate-binding protein